MSVPVRLAAFAAVLALAFGAAALAGAAIGGDDSRPADADGNVAREHGHGSGEPGGQSARQDAARGGEEQSPGAGEVGGLAVSDGGYTLRLGQPTMRVGDQVPFAFHIADRDGRPVRDRYEVDHKRELHLIVVRRDTENFQHVHPRRDADGTWRTELDLSAPGVYKVFADVNIGGQKRTLARDAFVAGEFLPQPLPAASKRDSVDGLDVELRAPELKAGRETTLTFAVTRDGQPFDELEPYLGAQGHLVVLREGDLAYLHVHPVEGGDEHGHADGSASSEAHGNETAFAATFPTAGRYRLFLEFKTGGEVRRVGYTVEVQR
jgi:hypothetical protein